MLPGIGRIFRANDAFNGVEEDLHKIYIKLDAFATIDEAANFAQSYSNTFGIHPDVGKNAWGIFAHKKTGNIGSLLRGIAKFMAAKVINTIESDVDDYGVNFDELVKEDYFPLYCIKDKRIYAEKDHPHLASCKICRRTQKYRHPYTDKSASLDESTSFDESTGLDKSMNLDESTSLDESMSLNEPADHDESTSL